MTAQLGGLSGYSRKVLRVGQHVSVDHVGQEGDELGWLFGCEPPGQHGGIAICGEKQRSKCNGWQTRDVSCLPRARQKWAIISRADAATIAVANSDRKLHFERYHVVFAYPFVNSASRRQPRLCWYSYGTFWSHDPSARPPQFCVFLSRCLRQTLWSASTYAAAFMQMHGQDKDLTGPRSAKPAAQSQILGVSGSWPMSGTQLVI